MPKQNKRKKFLLLNCNLPFQVIKNIWQQEVKQRPKLCQVVLQGGTSQQQFVVCIKPFQFSDKTTVHIFNPMTFIYYQILPEAALQKQKRHFSKS